MNLKKEFNLYSKQESEVYKRNKHGGVTLNIDNKVWNR